MRLVRFSLFEIVKLLISRDGRPRRAMEILLRLSRAGQATDDSMAHAHCTLDTKGYKHTLRICNTYCFPLQQQWLHDHTSMLRHRTLPAFLVHSKCSPQ